MAKSQTIEKPFFAVNLTLSVRAYALPARCDYVGIAHMGEPLVVRFQIINFSAKRKVFCQRLSLWERCRTQ